MFIHHKDAKARRITKLLILLCCFWGARLGAEEQETSFRVSAVQENQVWIEGGLLDGLQEGSEGEIYYEITVLGQKKRIVPAKVHLMKVDDNQSIGSLRDQSGTINVGYKAALVPKPVGDRLILFHSRGTQALAGKDYNLAKQLYQRILEALPGDPFALQRIKECDAGLAKLAELTRERKNVPYYKQAIRVSLESRDPDGAKIASAYIEKILVVLPGDPEALKFKEQIQVMAIAAVPEKDATKTQRHEEEKPTEKQPVAQVALVTANENAKAQERERAKETSAKTVETPVSVRPDRDLALPPTRDDSIKDMVFIPEGEVFIGMDEKTTPFWNETPRHKMRVPAFYIDRCEVTNEDYKKFCDATGRISPSYFVNGTYPEGWGRRPVVMISWIDADAYARWAGKRLPTELEWETAAAGREGNVWPWGTAWDSTRPNTREGSEKEPAEVGSHPGDVSPFQVYDMAGNVSEWTADWYRPYPGNTRREKEYGEQFRVLRGGSAQVSKEFARAQFRARLPDGFRSMDLGFRCALSGNR